MEFKEEQVKGQKGTKRRIRVMEKKGWQLLYSGSIKLNVCSVGDEISDRVRVGIIARDDNGRIVQAWPVARERVNNPVVAKVDAVWVALLVVQQNR